MFRNIPQLEAYYWVARLGSFRAAAERLGVTQPSVSIRIRELEEEAGGALFERTRRGVRMTAKGRSMFDPVERVITLLGDLYGHVRDTGALRGLLRMGVPDSFALQCLAKLMALLAERHPELKLAVTVDNSRALGQRLEEGLLDLAVVVQPENTRAFRLEKLGRQSLSWVASTSLPLPDRPLLPADIKDLAILTNPSPSPTFSILMDWFATHGLVPMRLNTCSSIAAIHSVVVAGGVVGVLPGCVVQDDVARGVLRELKVDPPLPLQDMYLAYSRAVTVRALPRMFDIITESIAGTGLVISAEA